jgi:integrase
MKGHIRRRGENSFELKYEAGVDPRTGKRITKYASVKGTKRDAQVKLAELIASVAKGSHVDNSRITVAEFVRSRIDQWEASGTIQAKTAARYRELNENQIVPHIGAMLLQKVRRFTSSNGIPIYAARAVSALTVRVGSLRLRSATLTGCSPRR